jgi:uncharacterized protein
VDGQARPGAEVERSAQAGQSSGARPAAQVASRGEAAAAAPKVDHLTTIRRLPDKQRTERTTLDEVLDAGRVAHVAIVDQGQPLAVPMAYARDGDRVLVHGSTASRLMRALRAGAPTCVTVTCLDGLVVARSAFESSMHYRSAMVFGRCRPVDDPDAALRRLTEGLIPGRTEELRASTRKELAATAIVELPIERWSVKVSDGDPDDDPEDLAADVWAGVVPIIEVFARPRPAADLRPGIDLPPSVRALTGPA